MTIVHRDFAKVYVTSPIYMYSVLVINSLTVRHIQQIQFKKPQIIQIMRNIRNNQYCHLILFILWTLTFQLQMLYPSSCINLFPCFLFYVTKTRVISGWRCEKCSAPGSVPSLYNRKSNVAAIAFHRYHEFFRWLYKSGGASGLSTKFLTVYVCSNSIWRKHVCRSFSKNLQARASG